MKKTTMNTNGVFSVFSILFLSILSFNSSAQNSALDYRRSSMTMILIEDNDLGKSKDMVINAYNSNPFPDKYNKHAIKDQKFSSESLRLTADDYKASGFYLDTLDTPKDFLMALKKPLNPLRYLSADSSKAVMEPSKNELLNIQIDKFIREKNLAKQLVSTWFNRTDDGKMNWDLILERGKYSASAEKLEQAKSDPLAANLFKDFDLLGNTYTVFNKMEFYENEPVARIIRDQAKAQAMQQLAGKPEILLTKALAMADTIYEKTKVGYTVKCNTYLYQLEWNSDVADKVQAYFFNSNIDPVKAWDTTTIFKLKFVGKTTTGSIVTFKVGETRTEAQIIDLQVKRTMDNALAKLQKEYVQFRPVAPITEVGPVKVQIGMKEGVEAGQTYEILSMSENEFGLPVYKSVGKVKVDKKAPIWDNRQGAEVPKDESGNPIPVAEFSTFSGGKKAEPGLNWVRLIK